MNLKGIADKDYTHAQKIFEFENFRNKCNEIYELDPAHFLSAPGLTWHGCLKKTEVNLELLTLLKLFRVGIDMLLMVEKGIWGGIFQAIRRYAKQIINHHISSI